MADFAYHYLRRHATGERMLTVHSGDVHVRRDDPGLLLVDCAWKRLSADLLTPSGPLRRVPVAVRGARLWLWRDRPWRLLELFGPSGSHEGYRIDFTTPLASARGIHHQVDLYLDLFMDPDATRHLVDDDDELTEAAHLGLASDAQCAELRAECARIVSVVEAGAWQAWLASEFDAPFDIAAIPATFGFKDHDFTPNEPFSWVGGT